MNKLQHLQYLNFRKPSRYADNITAIQAKPSLDLNFARNKSLMDNVTGNNLVTFTRASSGTFVNSNGVLQSAPVNFIRNNTMQGAVAGTPGTLPTNWVVTNLGTLSQQIVGVGTISGVNYIDWRISGTSSTSSVTLAFEPTTQIPALSGETWTHSCFIARVGGSTANIAYGGLGIYERTSAGVLVTANNAPINSSNSTTFTRQVYSATLSGGATVANVQPLIVISITSGAAIDITLRIGLPQLELGSSATEIIRTTGTINSAPRFDHNPLTGESLGLLVEESRTNLLLRSEGFDSASWAKVTATISANAGTSPAGTSSADKLIVDNAQTAGYAAQFTSFVSGTVYTASCYAKAGEVSDFRLVFESAAFTSGLNAVFNLSAGVVSSFTASSASIQPMGNGWYRCSATATATATVSASVQFRSVHSGNGTNGIFLWGAQLEAGASPTSYIPTTTAAATRSADVASITGANFSSWYRQDEGTVVVDVRRRYSGNFVGFPGLFSFDDGTANNRIHAFGNAGTTVYSPLVSSGGVTQLDYVQVPASSTGPDKIGLATKLNSSVFAGNGAVQAEDTSVTMPVNVIRVSLGASLNGSNPLNGTIRRLTYFPQRLSNANLQRITQ